MLLFIKFGIKTANIGIDEYLVKCPSCESDSWADVMVVSTYYHFTFVPVFPTDKEAVVFCKKCGLKRYGVPFNEKFFSNFYEIKQQFRHPWYSYIGAAIMLLVALIMVIVAINAAIR